MSKIVKIVQHRKSPIFSWIWLLDRVLFPVMGMSGEYKVSEYIFLCLYGIKDFHIFKPLSGSESGRKDWIFFFYFM